MSVAPQDLYLGFFTALSLALYAYSLSQEYKIYGPVREGGVDPLRYLFTPVPAGTFTTKIPYFKSSTILGGTLIYLQLAWMLVNTPEFSGAVLYYTLLSLFVLPIYLVESIAPKKSISGYVPFGYYKIEDQILAGLVIGGVFVVAQIVLSTINLASMQIVVSKLEITGSVFSSFLLSIFMIPMIEENVFRGIAAGSFAEFYGTAPGAVISGIIFGMFHGLVYGFNAVLVLYAAAFGIVAAFVAYYFNSIIPSYIAHVLINAFAFLMA